MARRRSSARRPQYPSSRGSAWLMVGLLIGLGIAVLMNWESVLKYINNAVNVAQTPKLAAQSKPTPTPKKALSKPPVTSSPQFDFYDMLATNQKTQKPKPSVLQEPVDSKPSVPIINNPTSSTTPAKPLAERYVIQIASLADYREADRLKAELTMAGFDVYIQPYRQNNTTWYRVNAGPYPSKQLAVTKQTELQKNNVSSVLIKQ